MELWIRSQNKEVLLNIKGIQYQNYKLVENETIEANILIGLYNYYDNEILGEYETKERALEVLTEIQNILKPKYILDASSIKPDGDFYKENGAIIQKYNANAKIEELSTFVYQMPEK